MLSWYFLILDDFCISFAAGIWGFLSLSDVGRKEFLCLVFCFFNVQYYKSEIDCCCCPKHRVAEVPTVIFVPKVGSPRTKMCEQVANDLVVSCAYTRQRHPHQVFPRRIPKAKWMIVSKLRAKEHLAKQHTGCYLPGLGQYPKRCWRVQLHVTW